MYVIQIMFADGYNMQVKCKTMSEVEKWIHDVMVDSSEDENEKFVLTVAYI